MKMYFVDHEFKKPYIVAVEIYKATEYNVWRNKHERYARISWNGGYFDSWEEARQYILEKISSYISYDETRIRECGASLAKERAVLAEVEAMKEE